ncbi:MAG: RIP metalloprotease RseP, partial [Bacteroidales bacterium]|nr:RIP metalloprotease RseP [Bacteroidales bacterium]
MVIFIKIIQVIFALSLLVLIHELGHYTFAKLFKTRVEQFYMFFNPKFSIFRCKRFGGKLHTKFFSKNDEPLPPDSDLSKLPDDDWRKYPDNTEYGIGWVPLGGYCAIAGMIDETKDASALSKEPQPWELRTKPAWQRFLIMFGGVLFNFLLAIVLYAAVLHHWGEEYLRNEDATWGIAVNDLSYEMGFRNGDRILSFDGREIEDFSQLQIELVHSRAKEALVLRGGDTVSIPINEDYISRMLNSPGMFSLAYPFVVEGFMENSINAGSGLEPGDRFVAVGGEEMFLVQDIQKALAGHKGDSIYVDVDRAGVRSQVGLQVDTAGMIQVMLEGDLTKFFNITRHKYGFFEAIPAGIKKACNYIGSYVKDLGLIFSPKTKAYKSVGSFITIGRIFPGTWDWHRVWSLTAMLSIMLAVLNIIPIPGLDGGHILFILVEIITGRKPSDKFLEVAQTIGMILLLALMVLAFGNDII